MNINNRPVFHDIIEETDITAEHLLVEGFLRSRENNLIRSLSKHTGGTNRMHDRLVIRDKDNKVIINESSIFDTLCTLGRLIGFDKIEASDGMVKNIRDNAGRWIL